MAEIVSFVKDLLKKIMPDNGKEIEAMIDDKKNQAFFINAFTSKTFNAINNYESLEKLGDTIFDTVLIKYVESEYFILKGKVISESQLAYTKDYHKSNFRMTLFAENLGLEPYIRRSKDKTDEKISADVFEALIGAIDKGFSSYYGDMTSSYKYDTAFILYLFSDKFAGGKFMIDFDDPNRYKDATTIVEEILKPNNKFQLGDVRVILCPDGLYRATRTITEQTEKGRKSEEFVGLGYKKKQAKNDLSQRIVARYHIDYSKEIKKKQEVKVQSTFQLIDGKWQIIYLGKIYKYDTKDLREAQKAFSKDMLKIKK